VRLGVVADVHANAPALRAVLSSARAQGVSQLLVAGDLVGYYYDAAEVLDELSGFAWTGVRGNHEDMLEDWIAGIDRERMVRKYGSGLAAAAAGLRPEQLRMLRELPRERIVQTDGGPVLLCHGAPGDPDRYVYPDAPDPAFDRFLVQGVRLVVHGHTHYPHVRVLEGRDGPITVLNPGSVGQPRNRVPGAHWALWDAGSGAVEHRVESYDAGPTQEQCALRDPHLPYLADVLVRR
jgi:putative phosphoesterase